MAEFVEGPDDGGGGEDERGGAGDVGDDGQARARGDAGEVTGEDLVAVPDGEGDGGGDEPGAGAGADAGELVGHAGVLVIRHEDFITGVEVGGVEDGADGDGRVGDEGEIVGATVEECTEAFSHAVGEGFEVSLEKTDGVALHAFADGGLGLEDGAEDGAVAARD
jgi:hypothetical protein